MQAPVKSPTVAVESRVGIGMTSNRSPSTPRSSGTSAREPVIMPSFAALEPLQRRTPLQLLLGQRDRGVAQQRERAGQRLARALVGERQRRRLVLVVEELCRRRSR